MFVLAQTYKMVEEMRMIYILGGFLVAVLVFCLILILAEK